ncbi:MAG: hypothetical protein LUG66_03225 [Clostridiales bacterium]|nr:hypothetical protein [Clostridiales bacterium]
MEILTKDFNAASEGNASLEVMPYTDRKRFLTERTAYFIFAAMVFASVLMVSTVFAATGTEALTTAKNLLSKAAQTGGGLYAVWGLVNLGMSLKDHNGPGIQSAIWQIIGGAIIIAAGTAISSLDLTIS